MPFSISARTLLELGKELISSDEVAIYELIKNAVDAGSPYVEISVQVVIGARAFRTLFNQLEDGASPREILQALTAAVPPNVPPNLLEGFRNELIPHLSDPTRFRAAFIDAYSAFNWIRVDDLGHGMSLADLTDIYLRIGTRSRTKENNLGSKYLGDKGVGRLSAMRLGDHLHIETTQAEAPTWSELDIPWDSFSHDSDADLSQIAITPKSGKKKEKNSLQGTKIHISKLSADWTFDKFADMVAGKIARLIDPFVPGKANSLLRIRYNGARVLIPSIPSTLLNSAHAICTAHFYFDATGEPILEGTLNYALRHKSRSISQRGSEILSISQKTYKKRGKKGNAAFSIEPISRKALASLGEFTCDIYWFNRRIVEAISDLTSGQAETRQLIRQWAGGPMLYRHGFRVLPYGDEKDDWLALDRDAFGSSGFKLNRQQVIGRVSVEASHKALSEQTNREGLVQSEESEALRIILMWVLNGELRSLINDADKDELLTKRDAEINALEFKGTQDEVQKSLTILKQRVSKEDSVYLDELERQVNRLAGQCASLVSRLDKSVDQAKEDREKFMHLAGIGLITEFIFHELDRAVSYTLKMIVDAQKSQREASLQALSEQLKSLQKRVSQFDDLTGEKRQVKTLCDVTEVVRLVLDGHANQFIRHNVKISFEGEASSYSLKAVRGMMIQILENLLSNSVYWLKQQRAYEPGFAPEIKIVWDEGRRLLSLFDNGPGVAPERQEIIFQPFVSSKPPEQGRGLGLYISREMAEYHGWTLEMDDQVGRYRRGRLNGFVLDFTGEK